MVRYDLNLFEVWKPVPGYEGLYDVSSEGRVWSHRSHKLLSIVDNGSGYKMVKLGSKKGDRFLVHRLVCMVFNYNPNPDVFTEVNHINEDKSDNRSCNLEWCDRKYNINYGTGKKRAYETRVKIGNIKEENLLLSKQEKVHRFNQKYYSEHKEELKEKMKQYYKNKKKTI